MEISLDDRYGLSKKQIDFLEWDSASLGFDFIKFCDTLEITVSKKSTPLKSTGADMEVFIQGTSEDDERGNGYYGYMMTESYLDYLIQKEEEK